MKVKFAPYTKIGKNVKAEGARIIEDGAEMYRGVSIVSKGWLNSLMAAIETIRPGP